MHLLRLLRSPLSLPLAGAVSMATWLASETQHPPTPVVKPGIVWVYVSELCATAGDSRDCHPMVPDRNRTFTNRDACAAYLEADLSRAGNPRLMGSCLREPES